MNESSCTTLCPDALTYSGNSAWDDISATHNHEMSPSVTEQRSRDTERPVFAARRYTRRDGHAAALELRSAGEQFRLDAPHAGILENSLPAHRTGLDTVPAGSAVEA